jgi:tRNA nucleotidyltransferase (CCA-adding enzyme)
MDAVEQRALRRILPTADEEERLHAVVHELQKVLSERVAAKGLDAKPLLVGSVAKGTHLHETEIDMFVAFPPDVPRDVLEKEGLALGDVLERPVRMFAEHPYSRGWYKGFEVEIVPCYRIVDAAQRLSAVDRTPLHVDYVLGHLGEDQGDQVRLLKAWAEGIGVYGAEAKIRGFSGYLCELLVLRYGTFRGVLEAASSWRAGLKIEFERPATRPFPEPLAVVDPIDGNRNVASAVSAEQMAAFAHAARVYLSKPSERFFFPRPPRPRTVPQIRALLRKRGTHLVLVTMPAPGLTEDVTYPQVRKAHRSVLELLHRNGFAVLHSTSGIEGGEVLLVLEFEVFELPRVQLHEGPPVWVANAEDFLRKWRASRRTMAGPHLRDDRWVVEVERDATDAAALLKREFRTLSLGKDLDRASRGGLRIRVDGDAVRAKYAGALTAFFDRRFPWER